MRPEAPPDRGADPRVLAANCAALAARDPLLAASIAAALPDASLQARPSRDPRSPVPVARGPSGEVPLHSLYDPRREADRAVAALFSPETPGCVVCAGLGGGYLARAALALPGVALVVVVERDLPALRSFLGSVPMEDVLGDPRLALMAGARGLRGYLVGAWHPLLAGGLRTLPLAAWCARAHGLAPAVEAEAAAAVEDVRADLSVQARFGRRWTAHMLLNLPHVRPEPLPPASRARVVAAGPSLEVQAGRLAAASGEGPLLAVDTALPALARAGIAPAAVVSIDCQHWSTFHVRHGIPPGTRLWLDLSSPPALARGRGAAFLAGGHPLAAWICARGWPLPRVDTGGGNVTHAAVSMALAMGAREITLYGADFSCPGGKPYARGTWLYDWLGARAARTDTLEGGMLALAARDGTIERTGSGIRYTTGLLTRYRDRLQALLASAGPRVAIVPGGGLPLVPGSGGAGPAPLAPTAAAAGVPPGPLPTWRDLLEDLSAGLAALPGVRPPAWKSIAACGSAGRALWRVVLPAAATFAREGLADVDALEQARSWTAARARRPLAGPGAPVQE